MIAINQTDTIVQIPDLSITINPSGSVDLDTYSAHEIVLSSDLPPKIADKTIVIRIDGRDLTVSEALRAIYGKDIEPRDTSGKIYFHTSPRPFGTKVHFSGAGDDMLAVSDIGGGDSLELYHNIGDASIHTVYGDLNTIMNVSYIQEGHLQWWNAKMDKITFEFVPRIVTLTTSENTPYFYTPSQPILLPSELIGGAGNVTINEDISLPYGGLVQALPNEKGIKPAAYWTADFNSSTGLFENIQPELTGNGDYNLFHIEYPVARFVNRVGMIGSGVIEFHTDDIEPVPHNGRLRCTWETIGEDHEWASIATFKLHREKSC